MKTGTPFLSIIVPAYNVEKYVDQCIRSILKQEFVDFELILVDDGSNDSTGQICDDYAKTDSRVYALHKKNGGLVSARKAGISVARGDYVAYVDGDDWIEEEMFYVLCQVAQSTNADVVISDFVVVDGECKSFLSQSMNDGCYDKDALLEEIYPHMLCRGEYFSFGFHPSLCSKIFRRSIILKNQMDIDEGIKLGEDAACFYPTILDAKKVVYLKERYYYFYRMRETSISHSIVYSLYANDIITLISHMEKKFFAQENLWSVLENQLWKYACYMFDNMITPCISFKNLFWSSDMKKELIVIRNSLIGKKTLQYCKSVRTSSRTKRILKIIDKDNVWRNLDLYLFYKFERAIK